MADNKVKLEAEISANSKGLQDAVKEASGIIGEAKRKVEEQNKEMRKGISVMQPIKDATARIRDGWRSISQTAKDAGGGFRGVAAAVRQCWSYATRFRQETKGGEVDAKGMESVMRGLGGRLMGVGAVMAALHKAWQNVVALVKEYAKNLEAATKARMYGNAAEGAEDMNRAREKENKRRDELADKLAKFAELIDEEKRTRSKEATAKRVNAQIELKNLGFEFGGHAGDIENMDEQIAAALDKYQRQRLAAIDAQIKANERAIKGANKYIDTFTYGKMVKTNLLGGDKNGEMTIKEAREKRDKAAEQNLALMEERHRLAKQDVGAEFLRLREAKKADEESAKTLEAREAARKHQEERDRQQADAEKARIAAEEKQAKEAAAAAEQRKREHEQTQRQIEQYRDAYKGYVSAQRSVTEAQKSYARAVRDNAREAEAEAIQQRRDRLQRRMSRYGFAIYEGFRLGESVSRRRRRQRTAQLDEGIAEKMGLSEQGERVRWSSEERRRIRDLQSLQKKDKALEAAQKQMTAAEKQERAAEQLQSAAAAIRSAVWGRDDAGRVLSARGVGLAGARANRNYAGMFQQLHADLQELNKRIYIVR